MKLSITLNNLLIYKYTYLFKNYFNRIYATQQAALVSVSENIAFSLLKNIHKSNKVENAGNSFPSITECVNN